MPNKTFDTIAGCAFLVSGMFFLVGSTGISKSSYGSNVGPSIFPFGLGAILIFLSMLVIYKARNYRHAPATKGIRDYRRFALVLSATVVYVFVFEPLGYVISTFLFLTFVFQVMERKKLLHTLIISGLFSFSVYYLYVIVFQGTLPSFPEWLGL
jgi:putative tricarboxylic transport membrane protein